MSDPENDLVYNERIYLIRGKAYFQLSNYYATILNLKKITAYEKDTSAIKYLALSYFNIGKYNEAERLIDKALILNQNDEDLIYGRFLVNKNKNHEPGMFADLLELLDAQPNNIKYLKLMGDYYFDQKKYLDAWVQYEKISKADPKNSFAWMLMGNCYLALNDKQSALSHFKKASFLGNLYVEKIIEGLENNFAFINDENVKFTINPSQSSKAILNLNTGFKVKIINEINEKIALCAVYGIENTDIIMGYIPTKNLSISLMGVPKAAINEKMPYSLPEKSPILKTPSTKIFYKEWLQQMPNIK
jgi:tetratricopeptide (TPR) repeat protein